MFVLYIKRSQVIWDWKRSVPHVSKWRTAALCIKNGRKGRVCGDKVVGKIGMWKNKRGVARKWKSVAQKWKTLLQGQYQNEINWYCPWSKLLHLNEVKDNSHPLIVVPFCPALFLFALKSKYLRMIFACIHSLLPYFNSTVVICFSTVIFQCLTSQWNVGWRAYILTNTLTLLALWFCEYHTSWTWNVLFTAARNPWKPGFWCWISSKLPLIGDFVQGRVLLESLLLWIQVSERLPFYVVDMFYWSTWTWIAWIADGRDLW